MTATTPTFGMFTKLRDGTWGVRFPRDHATAIGDLVQVQKKNGNVESVVITGFDYASSNKTTRAWRFVRPGDNTAPIIAQDLPAPVIAPDVTGHENALPVIPTDRVFWHGATRTFSCELSDLYDVLPVLTDAVILRSHLTGKDVVFTMNRVEKDRDGDTVAWELLSEGATGMKLTLFND